MAQEPTVDTGRLYLLVVDESAELHAALRFACRRARRTGGRVALLMCIQPADFQHWMAVEDLMREERRQEAEELLQKIAGEVQAMSGTTPVLYLRDGKLSDELFSLIEEDQGISVLVLGADTGPKGPGPLVASLAGKVWQRIRVPVLVVPGGLTDEEVDALA